MMKDPNFKPKLAIVTGAGWGVRNYLLSGAFSVLQEHFRLLILSPYAHIPEFQSYFSKQNVECFPQNVPSPERLLTFVMYLYRMSFYRRYPTVNKTLKWRRLFSDRPRLRRWIGNRLKVLAPGFAYPFYKALCRQTALHTWKPVGSLISFFHEEQVDAVFSTNMSELTEWPATLAGKALGLPVIAAATSWDNPTTKLAPPVDLDGYLVWGTDMREQMHRFMGIQDVTRVCVVGAPQFDFYLDPSYHQSRKEFCQSLGLDPRRKIIVYATVTPGIVPDNADLIRRLYHIIQKKKFPGDPQLLVRLHPKDRIERYAQLRDDLAYKDITWTLAGAPRIEGKDQWCPSRSELVLGVNTVRHGDVNVHAGYSTMILDFAALDKPVVLIGFDSQENLSQGKILESYEHLRPVIESGATLPVYSYQELEKQLEVALTSPEKQREQRRQLTHFELGEFDGNSGKRAGLAIVKLIQQKLKSPALLDERRFKLSA